jgi:hypothetical protein
MSIYRIGAAIEPLFRRLADREAGLGAAADRHSQIEDDVRAAIADAK